MNLFRTIAIASVFLIYKPCLAEAPSWFVNENVKAENTNIYIGYGEGATMQDAKQNARNDIATQLSVRVSATIEIDQKVENGEFTHSNRLISKQHSQVDLKNLSVVKSEFENGKYYVALSYQLLSLAQEFVGKFGKNKCSDEPQHPYLEQTLLFKRLNEANPCKLNIELVRKNETWMFSYRDILVQIDPAEVGDLYATTSSELLLLRTSTNQVKEGHDIDILIETTKTGFVTLFNVYGEGAVSLVQANIPVAGNTIRPFPVKEDKIKLVAALANKGEESVELFFAIMTSIPGNYANFKVVSETNSVDENQYQLHTLFNLAKEGPFASTLVRIVPK